LNIRIPVAASARDTLLDPRPELVTYTASRHRHEASSPLPLRPMHARRAKIFRPSITVS
jgi:hypothetical protein